VRTGASTRLLVVLGDPIAHSLSPTMFNAALAALGLDAVYVALRVPPDAVPEMLAACAATGVAGNVTVPLKTAVERCLARKTALCSQAGACNTFWVEQGTLVGDNTDIPAIGAELADLAAGADRWLVLGTGGSARAVALAAAAAGARLAVRSRDPERAATFAAWAAERGVSLIGDAPGIPDVDVVVNATPLGLQDADPLPLAPRARAGFRAALDLVYRPGGSHWVRELARTGVAARDGRGVLVRQGALAWDRFFPEAPAPLEVMRAAVERALRD
jgi:shikimate dehydrogenase